MWPDNFIGKVLLSFLDKIFLVVLTGIIVFTYQQQQISKQEQYKKIMERVQANTTIFSSILLKQRDNLIDTMGQYFFLFEEIAPDGKAKGDKAETLGILRKRIILICYNLYPIDKSIRDESKPLVKAVSQANQQLIERKNSTDDIQKMSDSIQIKYIAFLIELNETIRDKIIMESGLEFKGKEFKKK